MRLNYRQSILESGKVRMTNGRVRRRQEKAEVGVLRMKSCTTSLSNGIVAVVISVLVTIQQIKRNWVHPVVSRKVQGGWGDLRVGILSLRQRSSSWTSNSLKNNDVNKYYHLLL